MASAADDATPADVDAKARDVLEELVNLTDESGEGGVLVGAVIVAEMMGADGRYITYRSFDGAGEPLAFWTVRGYLEAARDVWTARETSQEMTGDDDAEE